MAIENVRLFSEDARRRWRRRPRPRCSTSSTTRWPTPSRRSRPSPTPPGMFGQRLGSCSLVDDAGLVRHGLSPQPRAEAERQWATLNAAVPAPAGAGYRLTRCCANDASSTTRTCCGGAAEAMHADRARGRQLLTMLIAPDADRDARDLGTIHLVRQPPRPFGDKEAALLKLCRPGGDRGQNARLCSARPRRLERRPATASRLLNAIARARSATVQPVLEAIVHSARKLAGGLAATAVADRKDG